MDVFLQRLQEQTEKVRAFQVERATPVTVLGQEYCLPCSDESLEGKLVIIRPASLAPEYRTADCQLGYALGGFGCSPSSRGRAVYFEELYSGKRCRWDRTDIICNRDAMLNGHGLYMGVSGSGKSMMAKQEIGFVALNTDHDIIVVDPEREYGPLIRALGGEVITISASNGSYVNALDISKEYGDGRNPLVLKSEFIMSLCEQLMGAGEIGAKEKSIIDRCTANIYRKYIRKYEGDPPTLKDLYDDLMRQKEPVAHEIALALELFTTGSLNVFAHQTNIDTRNRIICYDIQDLGENLKPIGLLVMLDSILNRVIRNRQQGRYTHVYIDEIYLFFASPGVGGKSAINNYSSEFLYKCWKRFRKYYATLTGITQNVEECLLSDTARLMFANSEFLVLLNQAPTDRAELAKLLDASDAQMDYVSDAPAGHGLIKVGSCLVPFINELPRDTELYRLMTTKPGEQNA